ncbi:site-specific integrase [Ruminococcus albus]|nr:site-specific integrase [Ruminococcus albus]
MKADNVEKLFARLSKKVGYKVHPHMLRHGFATEKLEAGWQMVDIQAYLRHKNLSSTQIYATYSDELKKNNFIMLVPK